jgi:hypothetical protein
MKKLHLVLVFLACLMFVMGTGTPSVHAKGKGKEKSAQKSKGKGDQKKKGKKWMPPDLTEQEKTEWKDGVPPGWGKGKKTGWGGHDVPPGWSKWKKKDKKKWEKDLAKARKKARKWAEKRSRKYGWAEDREGREADSFYICVDRTARAGVPVEDVEGLVERAINRDMSAEDIERLTRAVARGVGKGVGAGEVVEFTEKVMDQEITDEDVVLGVYRWLAKQPAKDGK